MVEQVGGVTPFARRSPIGSGRIVTSPRFRLPLFALSTLGALWLTMTVGTNLRR
jgi:hypothetical protein